MEISTSIELRAPVIPADKTGEYLALPPGGDTPIKAGRGGYFRAATDGAPAIWIGRSEYGDTPGTGVLADRAIGDVGINHWLTEMRALPPENWDAEQALQLARPVVRQLFGWIARFAPDSRIVNGRIVPNTPPPTPVFSRPPSSANMGGQTSGWLKNADGGDRIQATTSRLYVRRDALVRYLTGLPWPDGTWRRVNPRIGQKALENGDADWPGLVEARPPTGIGPLHGTDNKGRPRKFWSAAEVLAWGLEGWDVHGTWVPEGTTSAPMRVMNSACAPLCSLATYALFHDLITGIREQQHTLTMSWFSSRGRAPIAPSAKAINQWLADAGSGLGRVFGQHIGAIYVTIPDEMFPDIFEVAQQAQPDDQQWLVAPGSAWERAEQSHSEAMHMGETAREQIGFALDDGPLPQEAWLDLMSFGSTEQILRADRMGQDKRLPPAYTAPETTLPVDGTDTARRPVFSEQYQPPDADDRADLRVTPTGDDRDGSSPTQPSASERR